MKEVRRSHRWLWAVLVSAGIATSTSAAFEEAERSHDLEILTDVATLLTALDPAHTAPVTEELRSRIDAQPTNIGEQSRWELERQLSEAVRRIGEPAKEVLIDLLEASDPRRQRVALDALAPPPHAWWLSDRRVSALLLERLTSVVTEAPVRERILVAYFLAGAGDRIAEIARSLAIDEGGPDLARTAAFWICWHTPRKDLIATFSESSGILRQQAAIALGSDHRAELSPEDKAAVIRELVTIATATDLDPVPRGEAIEALGGFAADRQVQDVLLRLLDRDQWFFGVAGHHHAEHSLTLVVPALKGTEPARACPALRALQPLLQGIDPSARPKVEWRLKWILDACDDNGTSTSPG